MRPDKKEYYLEIARTVAKRSTCLRRQYGAVIVNHDEIIATGYNGSPRGEENCCDVGHCQRCEEGIPHGQQYEKCKAVHAEMNAVISAARKDILGADLYLAGFEDGRSISAVPCEICAKMLKNAGINSIVTDIVFTNTPEIGEELKCIRELWGLISEIESRCDMYQGMLPIYRKTDAILDKYENIIHLAFREQIAENKEKESKQWK